MAEQLGAEVTDQDLVAARATVRRGVRGLTITFVGIIVVTGLAAGAIVSALFGDLTIVSETVAVAMASLAIGGPLVCVLRVVTQKRGLDLALETVVQERVMETEARRREFETRLARALEMARDELAAYDIITRALKVAVPESPVELLLADNSHAHLQRAVSIAADGDAAARCPVASPDQCCAASRAQTQVYANSEALDACPLLRDRTADAFAAVCVPVSIMGRTVGVLHATGPAEAPLDDESVDALQVLANQAGNRLGLLRIMAETQLQASTDGLTGLTNRRSLENRARILRGNGVDFALVMADLDHFKSLNDTHGHECGDRALRVFAETLRDGIRTDDIACRYGGEEFIVLLPGVDVHEAIEVMERVREALARNTRRGDVPAFTASFGIAHSAESSDFEDLTARADRALFAAKDAGRDCICIDGHRLAVSTNLTAIN